MVLGVRGLPLGLGWSDSLCTGRVSRVCGSQARLSLRRLIKHRTRDASGAAHYLGKPKLLTQDQVVSISAGGGSAREAVGGGGFGHGWGNTNASLHH